MNNTLTLDVENFVTNALQAVIPMGPLADALEAYADESIEDDQEKQSFIDDWLDDDERRMVLEKIVLDAVILSQAIPMFDIHELQIICDKLDFEERDESLQKMKSKLLDNLIVALCEDLTDDVLSQKYKQNADTIKLQFLT